METPIYIYIIHGWYYGIVHRTQVYGWLIRFMKRFHIRKKMYEKASGLKWLVIPSLIPSPVHLDHHLNDPNGMWEFPVQKTMGCR